MPDTTLVVNNELLTSTAFKRLKDIRSQIDRPYRWVTEMEAGGKDVEEGGERLIIPFEMGRHSNTTRFSNGYEAIDLTAKPILTPGSQGWMDVVRPVLISGHENRINRGSREKIFSILDRRLKNTEQGLRAEFQQQALRGNVPAMVDLVSLNGFDNTTGFLEQAAVGAQSNVIHTIPRGANLHPGFQNQRYNVAGSASTLLLIAAYDVATRVRDLANGNPNAMPKVVGHISIECQNNLKRALNTNEQYLSEKELNGGRRVMMWGEWKLESNSDLPNSGAVTAGSPWSIAFIDHNALRFVAQKGAYFDLTKFDTPVGYDVQVAFMHLMGQMAGSYFGTSGVVYGAEVW
jgi:hypothetical protein